MDRISDHKQLSETFLTHFILAALFFPVYGSSYGKPYSPDFMLVNLFAAMVIAAVLWQKNLQLSLKKPLAPVLLVLLVLFNLAVCHARSVWLAPWYEGQINVTISVLFFIVLIARREVPQGEGQKILPRLLVMILVSNALGLIPFFLGYYGVSPMNLVFTAMPMAGQFDESRYSWFYSHKSEYAFMMVLFLALAIKYRRHYPRKWMFWAAIAVLTTGLLVSNTRSSMGAALFLAAGLLGDYVMSRPKKQRIRYLLCFIPLAAVGAALVLYVAQKRDLWTLGGRTYIWKRGWEEIQSYPNGFGQDCGSISFDLPYWPKKAYNAHNVFLNMMMQFSIPGGAAAQGMFLAVFLASWKKNLSFFTAGVWAALLIPLMMDWCLTLLTLPMLLLVGYFLFFAPVGQETPETE